MKRFIYVLLSIIVFAGLVAFLNIDVVTRQGINYQQRSIKIPLYLKIMDFFDRHYNYKELVKRIVEGAETRDDRLMKIFIWAHENIRRQPETLPVVDDHVWHIIIRGYGVDDQFSDVFTTLCNYAGIDAFFEFVYTKDRVRKIPLSFLSIGNGKWTVFDPYNGVYFRNTIGDFASIEQIKNGEWVSVSVGKKDKDRENYDYAKYFADFPLVVDPGLRRANIQSPLRRIMFEIKNKLRGRLADN